MISDLLNSGVDIICTQENDHPEIIYDGIKRKLTNLDIKMIKGSKYNTGIKSTSHKLLDNRYDYLKNAHDYAPSCLTNSYLSIPIYNNKVDIQNDTLTIYYNTKKIERINSFDVRLSEKTYFHASEFKLNDTNIEFLIINAHLESGEKTEEAKIREHEITKIIKLCNIVNKPSIILMDSNSSDLYELPSTGLGDIVSDILNKHKFKDILQETNNECYKMRHGNGAQPNKFGELMFDRIDKIAISTHISKGTALELDDFTQNYIKYNEKLKKNEIDDIRNIRNNKELRNQLKELVKKEKWIDCAGKCISKNYCIENDNLVECPSESTKSTIIIPLEISDCKDNYLLPLKLQMALYPNTNAPSDHPPCIAEIEF